MSKISGELNAVMSRLTVHSDEEYIRLLKKANKDLGDMVRERDKQIAAANAEIERLKAEQLEQMSSVQLRIAENKEQLAAAQATISAMRWQPIETAPKVGAHLAYDSRPHSRPFVIVWLDADHPDADGEGWYEHWSFDPVNPTHWMPLPSKPSSEPTNDITALREYGKRVAEKTREMCAKSIEWENDVARTGEFYAGEIRALDVSKFGR